MQISHNYTYIPSFSILYSSQTHQIFPSELFFLLPLPGPSLTMHKSCRTCGSEYREPLSGKQFLIFLNGTHLSAPALPAPCLYCCIYPTVEWHFLSFSSWKQLTKGRMEVNFSPISISSLLYSSLVWRWVRDDCPVTRHGGCSEWMNMKE